MIASYVFKKCCNFKILDGCEDDVFWKTVIGNSETSCQSQERINVKNARGDFE